MNITSNKEIVTIAHARDTNTIKGIWNPADYDSTNFISFEDANELITEISRREIKTDVIFEIGCGSGKITNLLSNNFTPQKIVACDISEEMIDFASQKYRDDKTINYLLQDFGVPWHELDERIRKLEGTVDLVFSSYTLHLVRGKKNALMNISRLLHTGGFSCVNIPAILFFKESETEKFKEREDHVKWIPRDHQLKLFTDLFLESGMKILCSETDIRKWTFSLSDFNKLFRQVSKANIYSIMNPNIPESEMKPIFAKYENLFLNFIQEKQVNGASNDDKSITAWFDRFRFICCKV